MASLGHEDPRPGIALGVATDIKALSQCSFKRVDDGEAEAAKVGYHHINARINASGLFSSFEHICKPGALDISSA